MQAVGSVTAMRCPPRISAIWTHVWFGICICDRTPKRGCAPGPQHNSLPLAIMQVCAGSLWNLLMRNSSEGVCARAPINCEELTVQACTNLNRCFWGCCGTQSICNAHAPWPLLLGWVCTEDWPETLECGHLSTPVMPSLASDWLEA